MTMAMLSEGTYVGGGQGHTLLEDGGEMENGDAEMDVNARIDSGECRFHRRQKFHISTVSCWLQDMLVWANDVQISQVSKSY